MNKILLTQDIARRIRSRNRIVGEVDRDTLTIHDDNALISLALFGTIQDFRYLQSVLDAYEINQITVHGIRADARQVYQKVIIPLFPTHSHKPIQSNTNICSCDLRKSPYGSSRRTIWRFPGRPGECWCKGQMVQIIHAYNMLTGSETVHSFARINYGRELLTIKLNTISLEL